LNGYRFSLANLVVNKRCKMNNDKLIEIQSELDEGMSAFGLSGGAPLHLNRARASQMAV